MLKRLERGEDLDSFLRSNQDKTVLVKFFAEWCAPCKVLQRNIEELQKEKTDLVVLAVDADRFPRLKYQDQEQKVQQLAVYSLPTLFLFQQNKMLKKAAGSMSVQELREFISV